MINICIIYLYITSDLFFFSKSSELEMKVKTFDKTQYYDEK